MIQLIKLKLYSKETQIKEYIFSLESLINEVNLFLSIFTHHLKLAWIQPVTVLYSKTVSLIKAEVPLEQLGRIIDFVLNYET